MAFGFLLPFRHRSDGTITVQLSENERRVLGSLLGELRDHLDDAAADDVPKAFERLFPVARPDDERAQDEWERLVHDELRTSRVAGIDIVDETLEADVVTPDQLTAWMQSINALRLVLGTRLGVSDESDRASFDPESPEAPLWVAYDWLTQLVDAAVRALRPTLPDDLG